MKRKVLIFILSLLYTQSIIYAQKNANHTDILFESMFFKHLEAEYLFTQINNTTLFEYPWIQPTQLSLAKQKDFTFFKIAQLNQKNFHATSDLLKIAYAQSEFYFSELASYHLANYYFGQKQFKRALEFIRMTTPFSSNNDEWKALMLKKSYCLYKEKQYLNAYNLFKSLNKIDGNHNKFITFYNGYLAYLVGEYATAISQLKQTTKVNPFSKVAPVLIVQAYWKQNKLDSIIAYSKISSFTPLPKDSINFSTWHKIIGYSLFTKGKYREAIPHFEQLSLDTVKDENSLNLLYAYAYALLEEKEVVLALPLLKHLFEHSSSENSLHDEAAFLLASAYLQTGSKKEARSIYGSVSETIDNKQKQHLASFQYAKISLELGYINVAILTLQQLNKIDNHPHKKEIVDLLAQALAISKDYATAYNILKDIKLPSVNLQKLTPIVLYRYAQLLLKTNNYQAADSLLARVQNHPYCSPTIRHKSYFWRAEIAIARSNFAETVKYLQQYEENISAKDPEELTYKFAYNYGYVYIQAKQYEKALNYLEKFNINSKVNNQWEIDALVYQADCHLMLKHYAKAYADYTKIIKLSPEYADYAYYQNCQIIGFQDLRAKETRLDVFERYYPKSPYLYKVLLEKVNIVMNDKRYQQAIPILQKMLRRQAKFDSSVFNINKTDLMLKLALAHYNNQQIKLADSIYKSIILDYPNTIASKEAVHNLKLISTESNTIDEFKVFIETANIELEDTELDSLSFSVVRLKILNKEPESDIRQSLQNYLSKYPKGNYAARANYTLAEQYTYKGQWEEALQHYKEVVKLPLSDFTENAYVAMAKIAFFDLKDYKQAKDYFQKIMLISTNASHIKDAMRGLLRIHYYEKNWGLGYRIAEKMSDILATSSDDVELVSIIYGKNLQMEKQYQLAIDKYKLIPKASYYYPETQYEIARCYMKMDSLTKAKSVALAITKLNTPNTFFYSRSYLLLGEVFLKESDYFNAKATFESLVQYATDPLVRETAQEKLDEISVLESLN